MRMGLFWLDFKLGVRMLSRYPMLTVVGSLAMAVARSRFEWPWGLGSHTS